MWRRQQVTVDLAHVDHTAQRHGPHELLDEQAQDVDGTLLAAVGQTPQDRPPDQDGIGPNGNGPQYVGARADATVDEDRAGAVNRFDNGGKGSGRGDDAIELAST